MVLPSRSDHHFDAMDVPIERLRSIYAQFGCPKENTKFRALHSLLREGSQAIYDKISKSWISERVNAHLIGNSLWFPAAASVHAVGSL